MSIEKPNVEEEKASDKEKIIPPDFEGIDDGIIKGRGPYMKKMEKGRLAYAYEDPRLYATFEGATKDEVILASLFVESGPNVSYYPGEVFDKSIEEIPVDDEKSIASFRFAPWVDAAERTQEFRQKTLEYIEENREKGLTLESFKQGIKEKEERRQKEEDECLLKETGLTKEEREKKNEILRKIESKIGELNLVQNDVEEALKIKEENNISEEEYWKIVGDVIHRKLYADETERAEKIIELTKMPRELVHETGVSTIGDRLVDRYWFEKVHYGSIDRIKESLNLSDEDVKVGARIALAKNLRYDYVSAGSSFEGYKEDFGLEDDIIDHPKVKEAVIEGMERVIRHSKAGDYDAIRPEGLESYLLKQKEYFNIADEDFNKVLSNFDIKIEKKE